MTVDSIVLDLCSGDFLKEFRFARVSQSFYSSDVALEWRHPLQLAESVRKCPLKPSGGATRPGPHEPPVSIELQHRRSGGGGGSRHGLVCAAMRMDTTILQTIPLALPENEAVCIEWTPEAVYRIVGDGSGFVVQFNDDSVLMSSSNLLFCTHHLPTSSSVGDGLRTYCMKELPYDDAETATYPIAATVRHALKLLAHYRSCSQARTEQEKKIVRNRSSFPLSSPSFGAENNASSEQC